MNTKTLRYLSTLISGVILFLSASLGLSQANDRQGCEQPHQSLMWKIEGENSTVHLFGSLHIGLDSFYPLAKEVEKEFRAADYLVFEVDPRAMLDPNLAIQIQQRGMLSPGEQLSDQLSPAVHKKLQQTLEDLGLPAQQLMRFRPWFLTLLLTNQQMLSLGYQPQFGVESYLLREKPSDTEILELENVTQQLEFLEALDGELYLAYTLNNMELGKELFVQLAQAWSCADKSELEKLLFEAFEMEGIDEEALDSLKDIFLTKRNQSMAKRIEDFIVAGKGNYFVVVGAAHYLGKDSIINFLETKGYEVEAIELKN